MVRSKEVLFLSLLILVSLYSCRVTKPVVTPVVISGSAVDYINAYKDLAVSEMKRTGIPASITLAQGMLESDYGRSSLARLGNNHFGIKCHSDWNGQTIKQHDDKRNECFRKYRRTEDSFYDHSDFLKSGSRYSFLFDFNPLDYKAWARGLKKAGYATNPEYANLLIRKIEENRLYELDKSYLSSVATHQEKVPVNVTPVPSKTTNDDYIRVQGEAITFGDVMARAPRIRENNRIQYIIVKDGDTKEKLENEFQLLKWELPRYNDLKENFTLVPGQILYLEPKRDKAEPGLEFHTVSDGETMQIVSQKYGIRLKSLLEMNNMIDGKEPVAGQKILLQPSKTTN
jgi:LysM repeat protein